MIKTTQKIHNIKPYITHIRPEKESGLVSPPNFWAINTFAQYGTRKLHHTQGKRTGTRKRFVPRGRKIRSPASIFQVSLSFFQYKKVGGIPADFPAQEAVRYKKGGPQGR